MKCYGSSSFSHGAKILLQRLNMSMMGRMKMSMAGYFTWLLILIAGCGGISGKEPINREEKHLIYTHHARCRMDCRHINDKEIREILERGSVNYAKSEPAGRPDPKYALEGYTAEGQHLRVIFAPENDGLVVITCIDLATEWQCDCQ